MAATIQSHLQQQDIIMQDDDDTTMVQTIAGRNGDRFRPLPNTIVLDWRYEMRREMQEIVPGLFLGPYSCSKNLALLQQASITHILPIIDSSEQSILRIAFPNQFIYHTIMVSDSPTQSLIPHFPQAKQFIDNALRSGGRVLVFCNGGISRSPAFVVAYVMETQGLEYEQAYAYVQNRRFCMNPNEAFKSQLKEYEPIYNARAAFSDATSATPLPHGRRRRADEVYEEDSGMDESLEEQAGRRGHAPVDGQIFN